MFKVIMHKITTKSKILIYGYGVEGQSTERFFKSKGLQPLVYDEFQEAYNTKPNLADFDLIVVSAGINPAKKIPNEFHQKCTSNVALFFHYLSTKNKAKVIGITGTKGKSMTTKLTHETLLKAGKSSAIAGNFGTGLLDLVETMETLDYLVIELSSYQLASLDTSPHYALCTNLYEDHLDWHGDVASYQEAKSHLWKYQGKGDVLFVPSHQAEHPLFNLETNELENLGTKVICEPVSEDLFPEKSIWRAKHYRENFGLVKALMEHLDQFSSSQISKFLSSFESACQALIGLPHRLQYLGTFEAIDFYDDAISTNPRSTIAAVQFLKDNLGTLILGGQDRDQNFKIMFEEIQKTNPNIHIIILPSQTADRIQHSIFNIQYSMADSMEQAVQIAFKKTPKGQVCLLSPAAPSFDHYKNYTEKGKDFEKCIKKGVQ